MRRDQAAISTVPCSTPRAQSYINNSSNLYFCARSVVVAAKAPGDSLRFGATSSPISTAVSLINLRYL